MKTFHYSRAVPLLILPFSLLLLQSKPAEPAQTAGVVAAVSPYYPASARQARVIGDVSAEVRIDSAGVVKSVKIILGHPLFRQAAEMAAWQWKFSSESKESSVRTVVLTFLFRLTPPCSDPATSTSVFSPPYKFEVRTEMEPPPCDDCSAAQWEKLRCRNPLAEAPQPNPPVPADR
jgi:TonB family protein